MKKLGVILIVCAGLIGTVAQAATYSFMNIPFVWDTPSGTATTVTWSGACTNFPGGDDDYSLVNFTAGFNFTFAGVSYSQVRIMSNGMIQFGAADQGFHRDFTSVALPAPANDMGIPAGCPNVAPTNVLMPYWLDINTSPNIAGAPVQYELLGSKPSRRFVITYNKVALYGNTAMLYTFQVVLRESAAGVNGIFEYRYTSGASNGTGATVGVQLNATDFTQYASNQAFIDTVNGTNIQWYPQNTLANARAVYRFDEAAWNGTAGQVLESSGNLPALNATSVGAANTVATTFCGFGRAGSFPANTTAAPINAVNTPITPGNTGSIDFWYRSSVAWNATNSQAMLFDATAVANKPFYLMKTANGALQFTMSDSAGTISTTASPAQGFAANTWQHVGVSWVFLTGTNQTFVQIFLNGALLTSARSTSNGNIAALSTLAIGDNRTAGITPSGGTTNSANGYIDEFKFYQEQINNYQAGSDMSCTALVDHYLIQSAAAGLTCAANPVTVVACHDAACTTTYTAGGTGALSASGTNMTVNWDGNSGGAAGAGFVFGASGSVVKNVQILTQGTATSGVVTLAVTSPNPAPLTATLCNFGNNPPANDNCVFSVSTAGFIFANSSTGTSFTLPTQVAGTATATNALYLRAVQAATATAAVCTPALTNRVASVNLGYSCNDPATCQPGSLLTVTDTSSASATAIAPAGTAKNLTFDANGSAPITVRYDDVGLITLNANSTVTPFTGATAVALTGSSNAFVVKPAGFALSAIKRSGDSFANPAAANATGLKFAKSGEAFSATVTALTASGKAKADAGAAINCATTPADCTPNYGKEAVPESVKLNATLAAGLGLTANPAVSGTFGTFTNAVATGTAFAWSEVGIITLTPSVIDGNYLGAGDVMGSVSGNVGRFVPDHFDTELVSVAGIPMACASGLTCPTNVLGANGVVYSGQPFSLKVSAKNSASAVTANYVSSATAANNFAKTVNYSVWGALGTTTAVTGAGAVAVPSGTTFVAGTLTQANQKYTLTSTSTAPTDVYWRADEAAGGDGVTSQNAVAGNSIEGGVKVLSGRIKVSNAYGSELLPLTVFASAQFYTANGWLNSNTDSITSLGVGASQTVGAGTSAVTFTPASGVLSAGRLSISLGKPSGGATGTLTLTPTAPSYLLVIPGTATFGVHQNNNNYIYRRESY